MPDADTMKRIREAVPSLAESTLAKIEAALGPPDDARPEEGIPSVVGDGDPARKLDATIDVLADLVAGRIATNQALAELDAAIFQFVLSVEDEWNPKKWAKETKRNFRTLRKAYDAYRNAASAHRH